jgi:uncharacterized protein
MIEILILVLISLGIGIFVSTASGTAATLLIPILTIVLGYKTHNAIGTTLAIDSMMGLTAGLIYLKNKNVDLKSSAFLILFGVTGSIIGSQFTSKAPEVGLKLFIGIFILFVGFNFARNGVKKNVEYINKKLKFNFFKEHKFLSFLFMGILVGFISGFSGLGGGRIIAVILIFVIGYSFHKAVGTSLFMMFFIAGTGAVSHGIQGEILLDKLPFLVIPAIIGALIGSKYANKIDEDKLARIAGVIIFSFGIIIIVNSLL